MLSRNKNSINIDDYFPFLVLRMVSWFPSSLSQWQITCFLLTFGHVQPAWNSILKNKDHGIQPHPSWQIEGENVEETPLWMVTAAWNQRTFASWKESYDKHEQCDEKWKHHSAHQTGRCLAFSLGFLNFLSSPDWSLKPLTFLVLHDSQVYFVHFFTQSWNQPSS